MLKNATIKTFFPEVIILSQWFLNLLSNQANAAFQAAFPWFDRRFKNHWLRIITI